MRGTTHVAGGLALGYLAFNNIEMLNVNLNDNKTLLLATTGLILGALIPDIDHHNSIISNKVKPIGYVVSKIFKHRGFTHSILGSIVITFLFNWILGFAGISNWINSVLSRAIYLGIASHILLDMLTPSGVSLLYPYNKKYSLAKITIGDIGESILVILFAGMIYYGNCYIL